jgi:hypothetical protein
MCSGARRGPEIDQLRWARPIRVRLTDRGGAALPTPFHLDWIAVAFPDERMDAGEQSFTVVRSGDVRS